MTDHSVIEIPDVHDLGKDAPVSKELRQRLYCDLSDAQQVCTAIRRLCEDDLSDWDAQQLAVAVEAMAYRAGRILDHWTRSGSFSDHEERRLEVENAAAVQEVPHHG